MPIDLRDDLIRALRDPGVLEALREAMRDAEVFVDTDRAAAILSMTPAAVRAATRRGQLPCHRLGRRLRFRRDELLAAAKR